MDWLMFLILFTAALVLSGAYYYIIRQQKKPRAWGDAEAVYYYVQMQFKKGFSEERIKKDLLQLSWKKDLPQAPPEDLRSKPGSIQDQGALVLRFALGLVFFYQGLFLKLINNVPVEISPCNSSILNFQVSHTLIVVTGMIQVIFALLLLAGLWTRLIAALSALYLTQMTLISSITGNPLTDAILLLAIALALVILGGGDASVDRYAGIP